MDTDSLIARIDQLLRGNGGGPPPPDAVLRKVVHVLTKARGGDGDEASAPDAELPSMSDLLASNRSETSSVSGSSSMLTASQLSEKASKHPTSRRKAPSSTPSTTGDEEENGLGGEHGMSLPLGRSADANHQRVLARHRARMDTLKVPVNIREQQTRQYQALLEGRGGKYVHADIVQNGATQIGGMTSQTPSMYGGPDTPMSEIASKMAAGGPPRIRNLPTDFKVA